MYMMVIQPKIGKALELKAIQRMISILSRIKADINNGRRMTGAFGMVVDDNVHVKLHQKMKTGKYKLIYSSMKGEL